MIHIYDLDGIICPEPPTVELREGNRKPSLLETLCFRKYAKPSFIPKEPFVILTGRPSCDLEDTMAWLTFHNIRPSMVFHGNPNPLTPELYKASVLKAMKEPYVFYESERRQVRFLRNQGIKVKRWSK